MLKSKVNALVDYYNYQFETIHGLDPIDNLEVLQDLKETYQKAAKYFGDVTDNLEAIHDQGGSILYEGAQGTLLDVDYGTYPYVTSSNTLATSVGIGSGFPKSIYADVLGVAKPTQPELGRDHFPQNFL